MKKADIYYKNQLAGLLPNIFVSYPKRLRNTNTEGQ